MPDSEVDLSMLVSELRALTEVVQDQGRKTDENFDAVSSLIRSYIPVVCLEDHSSRANPSLLSTSCDLSHNGPQRGTSTNQGEGRSVHWHHNPLMVLHSLQEDQSDDESMDLELSLEYKYSKLSAFVFENHGLFATAPPRRNEISSPRSASVGAVQISIDAMDFASKEVVRMEHAFDCFSGSSHQPTNTYTQEFSSTIPAKRKQLVKLPPLALNKLTFHKGRCTSHEGRADTGSKLDLDTMGNDNHAWKNKDTTLTQDKQTMEGSTGRGVQLTADGDQDGLPESGCGTSPSKTMPRGQSMAETTLKSEQYDEEGAITFRHMLETRSLQKHGMQTSTVTDDGYGHSSNTLWSAGSGDVTGTLTQDIDSTGQQFAVNESAQAPALTFRHMLEKPPLCMDKMQMPPTSGTSSAAFISPPASDTTDGSAPETDSSACSSHLCEHPLTYQSKGRRQGPRASPAMFLGAKTVTDKMTVMSHPGLENKAEAAFTEHTPAGADTSSAGLRFPHQQAPGGSITGVGGDHAAHAASSHNSEPDVSTADLMNDRLYSKPIEPVQQQAPPSMHGPELALSRHTVTGMAGDSQALTSLLVQPAAGEPSAHASGREEGRPSFTTPELTEGCTVGNPAMPHNSNFPRQPGQQFPSDSDHSNPALAKLLTSCSVSAASSSVSSFRMSSCTCSEISNTGNANGAPLSGLTIPEFVHVPCGSAGSVENSGTLQATQSHSPDLRARLCARSNPKLLASLRDECLSVKQHLHKCPPVSQVHARSPEPLVAWAEVGHPLCEDSPCMQRHLQDGPDEHGRSTTDVVMGRTSGVLVERCQAARRCATARDVPSDGLRGHITSGNATNRSHGTDGSGDGLENRCPSAGQSADSLESMSDDSATSCAACLLRQGGVDGCILRGHSDYTAGRTVALGRGNRLDSSVTELSVAASQCSESACTEDAVSCCIRRAVADSRLFATGTSALTDARASTVSCGRSW